MMTMWMEIALNMEIQGHMPNITVMKNKFYNIYIMMINVRN